MLVNKMESEAWKNGTERGIPEGSGGKEGRDEPKILPMDTESRGGEGLGQVGNPVEGGHGVKGGGTSVRFSTIRILKIIIINLKK